MTVTKETLEAQVKYCENELQLALNALDGFKTDISQHHYKDFDDAADWIEEFLTAFAYADCEGSYNCGSPYYEQEFTVEGDDKVYVGRLDVDYNRHDKTYYYVDQSEFSYKVKE